MKVISLSHNVGGTACTTSVAIKKYFYNDNKQTDFFDFLLVSMKSVNEVITGREIKSFVKDTEHENFMIFQNFDYMRSLHDVLNIKEKNPGINDENIIEILTEKYNRRQERLLTSIKGNDTIYFLRYCTSYENIEHDEIINFMNNIKNINKDLNFHLILNTTNYKEQKTQPPLKLLNMYPNLHMLYLDNYLTSEENRLNHLFIIDQIKFDKCVNNLKPIYNFVNNIENKINKNAVVILTRGYKDKSKYYSLIQRNKSISKNLVDKTTDIVIFNEGNIIESHQQFIIDQTPDLKIKFITIKDKAFLKKNERFEFYGPTKRDIWNYGYRHMCHFWFIDFLQFCDDYDYIIRIDEYCFIDFAIDDIFKIITSKILIAGAMDEDIEIVTHGMNNFTLNFLKKNGINGKNSRPPTGPYTNIIAFNLLRIRKNQLLKKYMSEVDNSNYIYIYRWGDLPLWGEVIAYLYSKSDYLIYNKINYYHGSLNTYVNKFTESMKNMIVNKKKYDKDIFIKNNIKNNNLKQPDLTNNHQLLFNFQR